MTIKERNEMFAKDVLTIEDLQKLLGMSYGDAANTIRGIKLKSDRLKIRGKIHVQDYLDAFGLDRQYYLGGIENNEENHQKDHPDRNVRVVG